LGGRFFYTSFSFGEVGPDLWAAKFKKMFAEKQFIIDFMYGGTDGVCARVVFSLSHRKNPVISPHGVGSLIRKVFPHKHGKGFAPVLTLDEPTLAVVIAHIARYRVTTEPHRDVFGPTNGDVGTCLAATIVEWVRFTSCRLMIDGLFHELEGTPLAEGIRLYNQKVCTYYDIPSPYGFEDRAAWNSKDKMADSVSAIFQVWPWNSAWVFAAAHCVPAQVKTDLHKRHAETTTAISRLEKELREFIQVFPGGGKVTWKTLSADNYPTALVHVLMQFPQNIQLFGGVNLYEQLRQIALKVQFCSIMSISPVDFRSDNLLALGVLASFDNKSSLARDHQWRALCKGVAVPKTDVPAVTSLPDPRLMSGASLPRSRAGTPAARGRSMTPDPRGRSRTPAARGRSRTPKSRSGTPPRSLSPSYKDFTPAADGKLLESISGLWDLDIMQDIEPGTQKANDFFRCVVLYSPDWIQDILNFQPISYHDAGANVAKTVLNASVLQCLKIEAAAMHVCGRMLYQASQEMALILQGFDPLGRLSFHLNKALQACEGFMPILRSFCHMESEHDAFRRMDAKHLKDGYTPDEPLPTFPELIQRMSNSNRVKIIYCHIFTAKIRLAGMCPEPSVYVSWDRIHRNAVELRQNLQDACCQCQALMDYCNGQL